MIIKKSIVSLFLMAFSSFQKPVVEGFAQQWRVLTQSSSAAQEGDVVRQILAYASAQGLVWEIEIQGRDDARPIPASDLNAHLGQAVRVILILKVATLFGQKAVGEFRWDPVATENVLILMTE